MLLFGKTGHWLSLSRSGFPASRYRWHCRCSEDARDVRDQVGRGARGTLRKAGYAEEGAAGRVDDLTVDPASIAGGEEGDDVANVAWIGYSSERAL
jgi:hypothetical protein